MAAVRRGACGEPGRLFGHSNVRPPTDVMAITSLPRDSRRPATRHPGLPPATRNEWRAESMADDGWQISRYPNLNLTTRTWVPMAETWDLKMGTPANHPVSGLPLLAGILPRVGRPWPWPPFVVGRAESRAEFPTLLASVRPRTRRSRAPTLEPRCLSGFQFPPELMISWFGQFSNLSIKGVLITFKWHFNH